MLSNDFIIIFISMFMNSMVLFNFEANADISDWQVVNDGVMGGRSQGAFHLNDSGHGVFEGTVSLENNGGFSSVRHRFETLTIQGCQNAAIRLRGDGERYQFRVKSAPGQKHSYIATFETSGEWQTVILPLNAMYPAFRGQKLSLPNYDGATLSEVAFLIGNKKAGPFRLELDWIRLQ